MICGAVILKATAERTDGKCMPCWKDPQRIERQEAVRREFREKLKRDKVIVRTLSEPLDHPYDTYSKFISRFCSDGLRSITSDELVCVLHCLSLVEATKCSKVIHQILDFIEQGCSPDGFFDPEQIDSFLSARAKELPNYESAYKVADAEETPLDQLEEMLSFSLQTKPGIIANCDAQILWNGLQGIASNQGFEALQEFGEALSAIDSHEKRLIIEQAVKLYFSFYGRVPTELEVYTIHKERSDELYDLDAMWSRSDEDLKKLSLVFLRENPEEIEPFLDDAGSVSIDADLVAKAKAILDSEIEVEG